MQARRRGTRRCCGYATEPPREVHRGSDMTAVQLRCEIDGCGMSWSVSSPAIPLRIQGSFKKEHARTSNPAAPIVNGSPKRGDAGEEN